MKTFFFIISFSRDKVFGKCTQDGLDVVQTAFLAPNTLRLAEQLNLKSHKAARMRTVFPICSGDVW